MSGTIKVVEADRYYVDAYGYLHFSNDFFGPDDKVISTIVCATVACHQWTWVEELKPDAA